MRSEPRVKGQGTKTAQEPGRPRRYDIGLVMAQLSENPSSRQRSHRCFYGRFQRRPPGHSPGVKWQNAEFFRRWVTSQNRGMATLVYADRERRMERARKNARRQSRRRGKRILRHSPLGRVKRNRKSAKGLRPVKLARHRGDSVCTYPSGLAIWQARITACLAQSDFTVVFYGLRIFDCKTAQLCGTQRECGMAETPSTRNGAQRSENTRKNSVLN